MKFDTFLATVDDWGRFQKVKYTLICLTYMLPPIMVYTFTFTAAVPKFRCLDPSNSYNDTYKDDFNKNFELTYEPTKDQCDKTQKLISSNECRRCYTRSIPGNQSLSDDIPLNKCIKFVYDKTHYEKTLVEEVNRLLSEESIF